jgi:hypothetical protein
MIGSLFIPTGKPFLSGSHGCSVRLSIGRATGDVTANSARTVRDSSAIPTLPDNNAYSPSQSS